MTDPHPKPHDFRQLSCRACAEGKALDFDFSMAFQPIVDVGRERIAGYEALVRGLNGEPARDVIARVNEQNLYRFDQSCRVKAISLAARLGIEGYVSINFLPNAVYRPELCIRTTLEAAREYSFPIERIMFEITEVEKVESKEHLNNIIDFYKRSGFRTALDDFGSGYAGLGLLTSFQPDILKIDRDLIQEINADNVRQAIVRHVMGLCSEIGIKPLAEGVETEEEFRTYLIIADCFHKAAKGPSRVMRHSDARRVVW